MTIELAAAPLRTPHTQPTPRPQRRELPRAPSVPAAAPIDLHAVVRGSSVEQALFATDYQRAEGLIEVIEYGVTVRSCRFVHVPAESRLQVRCAIDGSTYLGDGRQGRVELADGRVVDAVGPGAARDIPNWLLCPSLAPVWGRPGEEWDADTSGTLRAHDGVVAVPLRATTPRQRDGYLEAVWPGAYLRRLVLGDEHYVLRELVWQPIRTNR